MKTCNRCHKDKPLTEYYKQARNKDGLFHFCKTCHKAASADWAKVNRDRRRVQATEYEQLSLNRKRAKALAKEWEQENREHRLAAKKGYRLKKYGLTVTEYENLLALQNGVCAICGCTPEKERWGVLNVDHCHNTNTVRGLLCIECNTGLGKFKDSPALLQTAIEYLQQAKQ